MSAYIDWMGGHTPSSWGVFKLKHILREEKKEIGGNFPAGAISFGEVVFKVFDNDETLATYRTVRRGQFLINPLNLNYDLKSLRIGLSKIDCRVSPAYIVVSNEERLAVADYLRWALRVFDVQHIKTLGAGVRQTVNFEDIGECHIALPSVKEQEIIADYLSRTTNRIDALISKKTHFIELLSDKRQALITHAVTKGLDVNVPMKDSGVEWLGKIPAHWDVVPPVALFTESKERAYVGDQMLSATQKYGVIPLADFEALEQRQVTKAIANLEMRKHVEIGDFVISMRSMDGGLERSRAVGSVRSSYSVLKAGPCVEGRYFGALLKCGLYIQALRLTSNFIRDGQDLSFTHVKKVKLPKPGLEEQAAIADYLESATARIDALIAKTERSIELLREHRAALITAAVTGKIDLRSNADLRNAA
jgi:type I restriction enzyme S subunit